MGQKIANKLRIEGKLCFLAFQSNYVLTPARKALSNDEGPMAISPGTTKL